VDRIIGDMCSIIYRYTVGMGIFEVLLADPRLEDIYIDAPCDRNRIHVTMNGIAGNNSHIKCRTNLVVDKKEVMNLINILKRESGLQFCESNPILETDIKTHDARATVVGYPMSPNGDAVAIRKHSVRPWTLTRLVANGTLDPRIAGLLSFLVDNRATFLICGARGAGKSSLLSAMMFEFPLSQRILTIEDTMELPTPMMRKMGYKVQSMLIDDRMGGSSLSRADEALRVSLRMGESAIVLGEVRGEEARTMYQSMRTGRAGSSIMGTIHGDSAKSVYERVVHDMNISPEAFMATDILVTLGTMRDRRTGNQIRKVNEVVSTTETMGEFVDISDNNSLFSAPVMRRILSSSQMNKADIIKEIRARAVIRSYLAEVGKVHGEEYLGPEWVGIANDHVSRSNGKTAEDVLNTFKAKFIELTGVGV
jgi:type IV secretory pathway ATPase VirB11/archaellum biosynthesis ATPase